MNLSNNNNSNNNSNSDNNNIDAEAMKDFKDKQVVFNQYVLDTINLMLQKGLQNHEDRLLVLEGERERQKEVDETIANSYVEYSSTKLDVKPEEKDENK